MANGKIIIEEEVISYTRVPNTILRMETISWEAKGLYSYLIGLKKDWVIYKSDLANRSTNSYYSMVKAFKELEKLGYIETVTIREKGLFKGYEYFVRRKPICDIPKPVPPKSVSQQLIKTLLDSNINNNLNKQKEDTESLKKDSVPLKVDSKSVKPKKEKKEPESYQKIIEYWLKEFHTDFVFTATDGTKVKSIITKFKTILKNNGKIPDDTNIPAAFKFMCMNLPDYYKNKDLSMIDSKFNEIIAEIKAKTNGTSTKPKTAVEATRDAARERFGNTVVTGTAGS